MKLLHLWGLSVQSQCLLYLASSDLSVSLLSDVSSFASKSRTDIIRTRLETCSAHIRSPSLTGSVTHSRKKERGEKMESGGISNYLKLIFMWPQRFLSCPPVATTSTTIVPQQNTRIFPQSPRREKCNSSTEKASIFCNKKCHLKVHRNLLELV